jgi:hypothetical protein
MYRYLDTPISLDNYLKYFYQHGSERTCSKRCCFSFNKEPVALNCLISWYYVNLASPHVSDCLLCSAEHICSQSCAIVMVTLSFVSSACKVCVTYPGLSRLQFDQQNWEKLPSIKFKKKVSTWSTVLCRWVDRHNTADSHFLCCFVRNLLFSLCCLTLNMSGQSSGHIQCSARCPKTSVVRVSSWRRLLSCHVQGGSNMTGIICV